MESTPITRDSSPEEREQLAQDRLARRIQRLKRLQASKRYHAKILEQAKKDNVDEILLRFYIDTDCALEDFIETTAAYIPEHLQEESE